MADRLNFLPGPVDISAEVQTAFAAPPIWHRSDAFVEHYDQTRKLLKAIGKCKHVGLMVGSGTLANAVIAQELKKLPTRGLVLSNGEFGERLVRQARQIGLNADAYAMEWGQRFFPEDVQNRLAGKGWLWLAQCETSTGAVNLEPWIIPYCQRHSIKLCLDGMSAAGCMDVDYSSMYMASASSGKGFESYSGIAMVFYNHEPEPGDIGHPYFDLSTYHEVASPPFTFSSNLLLALHAALAHTDYKAKCAHNASHADKLKRWLNSRELITPLLDAQQSDHIWSFVPPPGKFSFEIGTVLEQRGVALHFKNNYLQSRNWLQLALLTNHSDEDMDATFDAFDRVF